MNKNPFSDEIYLHRTHPHQADVRDEYFRDQTKIIHSLPFRRLKHKTQVFFAPDNDHICTRIALFTAAERVALLHQVTADIPGVTVDSFDGLLVDYMRKHQLTVLVRGVRNAADLENEQAYAYANKLLLPALQSVLLPADPALRFVSSSAVRDAWAFGLELPGAVPPPVALALRAKLNASK